MARVPLGFTKIAAPDNFKYPEFTWLEPVMQTIQPQAIFADEFDPDRVAENYALAVGGYRRPAAIQNEMVSSTRRVAKILVRHRGSPCKAYHHQGWTEHHVQLWLIPGRYTEAKAAKQLAAFSMQHLTSHYKQFDQQLYLRFRDALLS